MANTNAMDIIVATLNNAITVDGLKKNADMAPCVFRMVTELFTAVGAMIMIPVIINIQNVD